MLNENKKFKSIRKDSILNVNYGIIFNLNGLKLIIQITKFN